MASPWKAHLRDVIRDLKLRQSIARDDMRWSRKEAALKARQGNTDEAVRMLLAIEFTEGRVDAFGEAITELGKLLKDVK